MSSADRDAGLSLAAAHLGLLFLVQVESYVWFVRGGGLVPPGDAARFALCLPWLQLEHLSVAGLLGLLTARCWSRRWLRPLPLLALLLLDGYALLDQAVYALCLSHLNPTLAESSGPDLALGLRALLEALRIEIGLGPALLNALAALALAAAALAAPLRAATWTERLRSRRGLTALLLGVSVLAHLTLDNHGLEQHPCLTLLRRGAAPSAPSALASASADSLDLRSPLYAEPAPEPEVDAALRAALARLERTEGRPDLLFVMLESVGAEQLFPGGRLDPARTPNLARRFEAGGVAFTSLYATYPATTRSLVSLFTGGHAITWGGVFEELSAPYPGPTLVSVLRERGYATALFSAGDLRVENCDRFLAGLAPDRVAHPGLEDEAWRAARAEHTWGVSDEAYVEETLAWLRDAPGPAAAFYLTISTHYPYPTPEARDCAHAAAPASESEARYLRALRAADAALERLLAGVDPTTRVVLVGDHGQAFGRRHPGNLLHKHALYEENVRSFLLLLAPDALGAPVLSPRVASLGDVLPTLARALGLASPEVPGQSLWPDDYALRRVYFHTLAHPPRWGLRDGPWKFVGAQFGGGAALYDLRSDPQEQTDLAARYPGRIARYAQACAAWYARVQEDFRQQAGASPEGLHPADFAAPGLKRIDFPGGPRFGESQTVVCRTLWVAWGEPRPLRYRWVAPSGESWVQTAASVQAGSARAELPCPAPTPRESGTWRVVIEDLSERAAAGATREVVLGAAEFEVELPPLERRARASLAPVPLGAPPGLTELRVGTRGPEGDVAPSAELAPTPRPALRAVGTPSPRTCDLLHTWRAPSGRTYSARTRLAAGRRLLLADYPGPLPLELGSWLVTVAHERQPQVWATFSVGPAEAVQPGAPQGAR